MNLITKINLYIEFNIVPLIKKIDRKHGMFFPEIIASLLAISFIFFKIPDGKCRFEDEFCRNKIIRIVFTMV